MKVLMLATWYGRFEPGPFRGYGLWRLGSFVVWLLVLGLLGALLVTLLRRRDDLAKTQASGAAPGGAPAAGPPTGPMPTPLEVVKLRYARGELTKDEFEAIKHDLE